MTSEYEVYCLKISGNKSTFIKFAEIEFAKFYFSYIVMTNFNEILRNEKRAILALECSRGFKEQVVMHNFDSRSP